MPSSKLKMSASKFKQTNGMLLTQNMVYKIREKIRLWLGKNNLSFRSFEILVITQVGFGEETIKNK